MNILYISALEGGKYTGPIYSVPRQIKSQKKHDNVYWINLTKIENSKLFDPDFYHYMSWKTFEFSKLPLPFNRPDIIVFEEFFKIECCLIARKAEKANIPYLIIPRCQMTENYLKNKQLKKIIASKLLFDHFAKKSVAVQFLTEQEKKDSSMFYSGKAVIAPNGILLQTENAKVKQNPVIGTFIGRYSIWQKGLDLLLEAIKQEKSILEECNIKFQFYGPDDRTGSSDKIKAIIDEKGLAERVQVNPSVFDEKKKEVLLNSSFFVHTSRFEGMPMSVLEALSYGIPCLVTQGSNMREAIDDFDAGWGTDNTVEGIRKALIAVCNSLDMLETKGENAKKLAREYSWEAISKKTHETYKELI